MIHQEWTTIRKYARFWTVSLLLGIGGGTYAADPVVPVPSPTPTPTATPSTAVIPPGTEILKPAPTPVAPPPPELVKGWPPGSDFDRIEGNTIYFKGPLNSPRPHPLKTKLFGLEYVGVVSPKEGGFAYVFVKGADCDGCKDKHLYLIRADGGSFTQLIMPGKVRDRKNGSTLLDSSAFFGRCLNGKEEVYVSYQREKVDRRKYMQISVMVIEIYADRLHEKLLIKRLPNIRETLRRVKLKQCTEIKPEIRESVPFVLDREDAE